MRDGRVEQTGKPEEIYSSPISRWIAEFLGDAKVLPGTAANGVVECELGSFPTERSFVGAVDVVVRPELLSISAGNGSEGAGGAGVPARVVDRSYFGHDQVVELELPSGQHVRSRSVGTTLWHSGDEVRVAVSGPVSVIPSTAPLGDGT